MARRKISRQYWSLDASPRRYLLISLIHRSASADKRIFLGNSSISIPIALDLPSSVGIHKDYPYAKGNTTSYEGTHPGTPLPICNRRLTESRINCRPTSLSQKPPFSYT